MGGKADRITEKTENNCCCVPATERCKLRQADENEQRDDPCSNALLDIPKVLPIPRSSASLNASRHVNMEKIGDEIGVGGLVLQSRNFSNAYRVVDRNCNACRYERNGEKFEENDCR